MLKAVYRILDAAANRASEGIRTVEEWLRFGLDDSEGAAEAKQLRHALASALSLLPREALLKSRDTGGDVGTGLETRREYERHAVSDVLAAAAQRVQQSLRVLEEYGKTVDVEFARQIEVIRYRAYILFQRAELQAGFRGSGVGGERGRKLAAARLYVLIDCGPSDSALVERVRCWAEAGVDVFQLRDKTASDRTLYHRAKAGAKAATGAGALFLVNDRADLAHAADADGVHVGQDELPVAAAKRVIGRDRIVGLSTHDLDQVRRAVMEGADYLGCGPTFPSETKSFTVHAGTDFLQSVQQELHSDQSGELPAFAIGGIDSTNLRRVTESGFSRIAVTAAVSRSDDPMKAIRHLRAELERHAAGSPSDT